MKSKHLLLTLLLALLVPWAANAQTDLSVCNGTDNSQYIPFEGYNADASDGQQNQMLYPANLLTAMVDKEITTMKFYIDASANNGSYTAASRLGTWTISLGETEETTLTGLDQTTPLTPVYTGYLDCSSGILTIAFDNGYIYNGKNLLVQFYKAAGSNSGQWNRWYFLGVTTENNASYGSYNSTHLRKFLPKNTFTYQTPATCPKPTLSEVADEDITSTTATIRWTPSNENQTLFDIYYSINNTAPDGTTTPSYSNVSGTSKEITGLNPVTQYYVWLRGNCGTAADPDISGGWTSAKSFMTDCGAVGIGYTCGFEGPNTGGTTYNPLPACWSRPDGTNTTYPYAYNYSYYAHDGSYSLYFNGNASSTTEIAVLPEIDGGVNGKRLAFYARFGSTNYISLSVGYMNGSNFVEVQPITPTISSSYQLCEVDFANVDGNPTNMAIKFNNSSSSSYSIYIDDLELKASPTCFRPTMVTTATNIGPTTATVSWTPNGDQDHWDVYYCTSPYTAPTATTTPSVENTADNPCTLTGLTPSTSYRVYVRGNCGSGDVSEWSTNYCTVPTPAYCADMQVQYSTITFSNITYNSANVGWTIAGEATEWKVQCSQDNTFETIDKEVIANTNSAALSGLTAEKTYYVRIAPYCAEATDYTPWSSNKSFTTPESCPAPVLAEPTNTTAYGATLTWTGTSDHYDVMVGEETITTVLDANFENNQIPTGFTNSTTYPWVVMSGGYNSNYCAVPGNHGTHSSTSDLTYTVELTETATVSFYAKISSEGSDHGRFFIDGTQKMDIAGTSSYTTWSKYSYELTAGTHTLIWRYYKDSSVNTGEDYFYVDDITIKSSSVGTWQVAATNVTESPYVLSNNAVLSPETDYQVKLIGYCPWTSEQTESNAQSFTTSSSCETPSGLAESEVTNESVKITWETHGLTTFNLRYRTGTEEWETKNNVACPYTIEGLDGNTTYEVQVQATCNTTEWSTALSFTTKCDLVTDLPWSEDFESYDMGNFSDPCWVNEHIAGSSTYVFQVYTSSNGTNTTHQLQLPDQNDGNMTKLVLPGMTLPNDNYAFFIDVYRTDNYSSYTTEGIRVFASTNGEIEGATELAFIPRVRSVQSGIIPAEDAIGWYTYALPINMSGNCYIILRGESKYGNATYMDNFIVASCYPVGTLSLVEYGSTSAKLSWTLMDDTQTAWDVAYKMEGETNFTIVSANTNENYLLEGLTPEKAYTVKVRANCGGGDYGVWSNEINFTTPEACPVPTGLAINEATKTAVTADLSWTGSLDVTDYTVQYCEVVETPISNEGFENDGEWPTGWDNSVTSNESYKWKVSAGSGYSTSGSSGVTTAANGSYNACYYTSSAGTTAWLIGPEMDLSGVTSANLSFNYCNPAWSGGVYELKVHYRVDGGEWQLLKTYNTGQSSWKLETITLSGMAAHYQIGFSVKGYNNDYGYGVGIDDVKVVEVGGTWETASDVVETQAYTLTNLTGGANYLARVKSNCTSGEYCAPISFTTLPEGTKVFTTAGEWGTATNWMPNGAPVITDDVIIRANATIESGCVAQAKKITFQGSPTPTLTINDGGQLKTDNTVTATVKKNITGYGAGNEENRAGYYLIANPLNSTVYYHTSYSTPNINSTGIREGNYDLYSWSYNSSDGLEWRNYETSSFSLYNGTGYLYANENNVELTFTGTVKANNVDEEKTPSYYSTNPDEYEFNGWQLFGNPFVCNAYLNDANDNLAFYRMNPTTGAGFIVATGAIAPMEGIFVQATDANQTFKFSRNQIANSRGQLNINLSKAATRGTSLADNAIIRFGEGNLLEKFCFSNNSSKVYIPMEGKDYAVVNAESNVGEIPVSFEAKENGTYTLSFTNEEVSFAYLHLIDNMTGIETDLLANPSYTFEARTTDYASRFKLVFATGSSTGSDTFAYYSKGNWVINNEGRATLQVVDVNGRILKSESINGCANVNFKAAAGIYMIRLVNGDNVKVQKVVVK